MPAHTRTVANVELDAVAYSNASGPADTIDIATLTPSWLARSLELADGTTFEVLPEGGQ